MQRSTDGRGQRRPRGLLQNRTGGRHQKLQNRPRHARMTRMPTVRWCSQRRMHRCRRANPNPPRGGTGNGGGRASAPPVSQPAVQCPIHDIVQTAASALRNKVANHALSTGLPPARETMVQDPASLPAPRSPPGEAPQTRHWGSPGTHTNMPARTQTKPYAPGLGSTTLHRTQLPRPALASKT